MEVKNVAIGLLKPYAKNAKKHPDEQVDKIARSIKEFGFKQPIVVDKKNVVIIGHGRLLAAKRLGLLEVPVVVADDLTPEQVNALRLADNKVAESPWDDALVFEELQDITLDMEQFGFSIDDFIPKDDDGDSDEEDDDFDDDTPDAMAHNVFENQELRRFPYTNYYGAPEMAATQTVGDKLLRFRDYFAVEDRSEYIAHFYYDDYKFIQAWRNPDKYLERLREFKAVISPDFSLYTDFPRALQILSHYRRQWCGAYWQEQGIDVIPDVVWGDEESFNYCFEGLPVGGTVAVSSVGVKNDAEWNGKEANVFKAGFDEMMRRLKPKAIIWYGDKIEGCEGNIIYCPSYYAERRAALNEKAREKDNGQRQE